MAETINKERGAQTLSDGTTVWINAATGECIGRFSKWGVDLHHTAAEQMAGSPQCRHCTHTKPGGEDWVWFVRAMSELYQIDIEPIHKPAWLGS